MDSAMDLAGQQGAGGKRKRAATVAAPALKASDIKAPTATGAAADHYSTFPHWILSLLQFQNTGRCSVPACHTGTPSDRDLKVPVPRTNCDASSSEIARQGCFEKSSVLLSSNFCQESTVCVLHPAAKPAAPAAQPARRQPTERAAKKAPLPVDESDDEDGVAKRGSFWELS